MSQPAAKLWLNRHILFPPAGERKQICSVTVVNAYWERISIWYQRTLFHAYVNFTSCQRPPGKPLVFLINQFIFFCFFLIPTGGCMYQLQYYILHNTKSFYRLLPKMTNETLLKMYFYYKHAIYFYNKHVIIYFYNKDAVIYFYNKNFHIHISFLYFGLVWFGLVEFYGISTIVGYLMPNPIFTFRLNLQNHFVKWAKFIFVLTQLMVSSIAL